MTESLISVLRRRVLYSTGSAILIGIALLFLIISLTLDSSWFLAGIAFSSFTFTILLFYLNSLWQESEWAEKIQEIIEQEGIAKEPPPSLQNGTMVSKFSSHFLSHQVIEFTKRDNLYIALPKVLKIVPFYDSIQKYISCCFSFFFWNLKLDIDERLYRTAAQQTISKILSKPLDPKLHAELANTYVALSKLFQAILTSCRGKVIPPQLLLPWNKEAVINQATNYAKLALEELQILSTLSPDTLWVHEQLAISYKELGKAQEEFEAWNSVIQIAPDDIQALVRIGHLAFQLKKPKDGLMAYEKLKSISPLQADEVIGAYCKVLGYQA